MKYIKLFLLMLLILNIMIVSAKAETGTITVSSAVVKNYVAAVVGSADRTSTLTVIRFDSTDYNHIDSLQLTVNPEAHFSHESGSTNFTIIGGGTGDGFISYQNNTKTITWIFNNAQITANPITLQYGRAIGSDITNLKTADGGAACTTSASVTKPAFVCTTTPSANEYMAGSYIAQVSSVVSNTYNVTYPTSTLFNLSINKSGATIPTKFSVTNVAGIEYFNETYFNLVGFSVIDTYNAGIVLNMSVASGANTILTVNSSGVSNPQSNPPGNGGSSGGQISYDYSTAVKSAGYGFVANITDANYTTFLGFPTRTYYINAYDTGGFLIQGFPISFTSQNYSTGRMWAFTDVGTWTGKLYYCSTTDVLCTSGVSSRTLLDTAFITISPTIYPFSVTTNKANYSTGEVINITVVNPSPGAVYLNMFLSAGGAGQAGSIEDLIVTNGTHYIDQTVTGDMISGQWEVGLYQSPGGFGKLANDLFTVGIAAAGSNVSSIMWGDQYFVGRTNPLYYTANWFPNTIRVYKVFPGQSTPTQIDSFVIPANASTSKGYLMDTTGSWSASITNESGNISWANITVFGKLETGCNKRLPDYVCFDNDSYFTGDSYKITYKASTFTNSLNAISLRLLVFDPQNKLIQNKTIFLNKLVISPPYTGEFNAVFVAANPPGKYHAILMIDGTPENFYMDGTQLTDSFAIVITKPVPGATPSNQWGVQESSPTASCTVWDSWTQMIFFGFGGLNNTTRFMMALSLIVAFIIIGFSISKGNIGAGIIVGFFPYAFFIYLSLAGGCGTYMPTWTAIFVALIIGSKMRWF